MANGGRFCYTLDVLTDGSEHTGCGTLFLSVWKIPISIRNAAASFTDDESDDSDSSSDCSDEENGEEQHQKQNNRIDSDQNSDEIPREKKQNHDPYSWLTGASESEERKNDLQSSSSFTTNVPIARYAISGLGDATARLCADQKFKLAPTRACFLPELGTMARTSDGLSALLLALYGCGAPSLHLVVPKPSSIGNRRNTEDGFVEDVASLILGAHKNLDIRTCEIREADHKLDSLVWWKVYEDEHLVAHASSSQTFLSFGLEAKEEQQQIREQPASLIYLYSFPTAQLGSKNQTSGTNPYCTLALLPPRCKDMTGVNERLLRQDRPMIRDGIPMTSIDYVLFLDPSQPLSSDFTFHRDKGETSLPTLIDKRSKILMTLPRNSGSGADHDEGILIRSQQLHRHFYQSMPWAFTPPSHKFYTESCTTVTEENSTKGILVLESGTSIVLEKNHNSNLQNQIPKERIWDRRKSIWKTGPKEEWTRPTLDSLQPFAVRKSRRLPSTTAVAISDENEIELEDDADTEDEDAKERVPTAIEDENEIDLDDEGYDESSVEEKESNGETPHSSAGDENEIDLDLDGEGDNESSPEEKGFNGATPPSFAQIEEENKLENFGNNKIDQGERNIASNGHGPRMVVLGTGCATPSAYRGSSGYALVLPAPDDVDKGFQGINQKYCYDDSRVGHDGFLPNSGAKNDRCQNNRDQIFLLDCGEGVSTMLSRNCGHLNDWKRKVRGIWISHAHLDHYGGLPTLLRLLCEERNALCFHENAGSANERMRKRPRHSSIDIPSESTLDSVIPVPWVVAPPKVLRYLDLVLDCKNGRSKDGNMVCFEPRLHHDPRLPLDKSSPFSHFESFKVHHNCCPAFGLLVGWNRTSKNQNYSNNKGTASPHTTNQYFCYSGDTRPSHSLVQVCNRAVQRQQQRFHRPVFEGSNRSNINNNNNNNETNTDLFLIHEATFRDDETKMAQKKKHSTLREAWKVATEIPSCSRVLMTHFSQRYDNLPPLSEEGSLNFQRKHISGTSSANDNRGDYRYSQNQLGNAKAVPPSLGLAMDGLWIDLE